MQRSAGWHRLLRFLAEISKNFLHYDIKKLKISTPGAAKKRLQPTTKEQVEE
jgi:hypothetical protein